MNEQMTTKGGFVITSVYFTPNSLLDLFEQRLNLMRVPEVLRAVHRAQAIIDRRFNGSVDLANYISSDDDVFLNSANLRSLSTAIIQVGLFERYLKHNSMPQFLVGNGKGDCAISVAAGKITLEDLIAGSAAFGAARQEKKVVGGNELPILAGFAIAELVVYKQETLPMGEVHFEKVEKTPIILRDILASLTEQFGVKRWVTLGPSTVQMRREESNVNPLELDVQWVYSIEADPMLSWFNVSAVPRLFAVPSH